MRAYPLFFLILFTACKNSKTPVPNESESQTDTTAKTVYLPIPDLIKEDIRRIESFAAGILSKTSGQEKTDSIYITPEQLKVLAGEFLITDLDSASFASNFKEESLADQSNGSVNFMYTPINSNTRLRKAIVYVAPNNSNADKVSKIYLEKTQLRGDTTIIQKLTWRMQHYFIIAESREAAGGFRENSIRKVIWEPSDFSE